VAFSPTGPFASVVGPRRRLVLQVEKKLSFQDTKNNVVWPQEKPHSHPLSESTGVFVESWRNRLVLCKTLERLSKVFFGRYLTSPLHRPDPRPCMLTLFQASMRTARREKPCSGARPESRLKIVCLPHHACPAPPVLFVCPLHRQSRWGGSGMGRSPHPE
jgi:hypothetical protein